MRIAVVPDIHGNLAALTAVIADLRRPRAVLAHDTSWLRTGTWPPE